MNVLPIRTISGRIVLGFFVLVATFGGVSGYALVQMGVVGDELRFVRGTYLETSLDLVKLQSRQTSIAESLGETPLRRSILRRERQERDRLLGEIDRRFRRPGATAAHQAALSELEGHRTVFADRLETLAPLYAAIGESPTAPAPDAESLEKAYRLELELVRRVRRWSSKLREIIDDKTLALEQAERQARIGLLALGTMATLVGLLVTTWAVLTLRPLRQLRDGARRVAGGDYAMRIVAVDQTEVADVAREFNAMAAAVQEREQELVRNARLAAVGKMAAVITHEIRNPLAAIGLHAELLEEELRRLPDSVQNEALPLCRSIHGEVDRLTSITEQYLRFARVPTPRLETTDLVELVRSVVDFQRGELAQLGVTLELVAGTILPPLPLDEAQLRQALLNLLRNGADAMKAGGGGRLTVTVDRVSGSARVQVTDEGHGISPKDQERIFEAFYTTKEGGTGLGLALTQQIVLQNKGRLEVISELGKGTTFSLIFALPGNAFA